MKKQMNVKIIATNELSDEALFGFTKLVINLYQEGKISTSNTKRKAS